MTDIATNLGIQPDEANEVLAGTEQAQESTLKTEAQVLLGSAAALARPAVRRRPIRDAVRALFASTEKAQTSETRKTPKHYPKRYSFIEDAAMSRMMDRL